MLSYILGLSIIILLVSSYCYFFWWYVSWIPFFLYTFYFRTIGSEKNRLKKVLRLAYKNTRFYPHLWGLKSCPTTLDGIPTVEKTEFQKYNKEFYVSKNKGPGFWRHTSGSTGQPFSVFEGLREMFEDQVAVQAAMRSDLSQTELFYRLLVGKSLKALWCQHPYEGTPEYMNWFHMDPGSMPVVDMIARVIWFKPETLCGAGSLLVNMAEALTSYGIVQPQMRKLMSCGETWVPEYYDIFKRAWPNAIVADVYGANETGVVCYRPDVTQKYKWKMLGNHLVEILDEYGQPCRPGEIGEVVITALNKTDMPMIRYKIGDLGSVDENGQVLEIFGHVRLNEYFLGVSAGVETPDEGSILEIRGRLNDNFVLKDGSKLYSWDLFWTGQPAHGILAKSVKSWRVVQYTIDSCTMYIVRKSTATAEQAISDAKMAMVNNIRDKSNGQLDCIVELCEESDPIMKRKNYGKLRAFESKIKTHRA